MAEAENEFLEPSDSAADLETTASVESGASAGQQAPLSGSAALAARFTKKVGTDEFNDADIDDFPDPSVVTPSMRQFLDIKKNYPNTLLLYRMGDFYETFFGDAIRANRLIGITLTKRGRTLDDKPIPMAGIPYATLEQYVARLVRMGESVVIVEQVGQPQKNGMMERRVSRIITPGTLTDTSLLPEKSDAILLSIAPIKKRGAAAGKSETIYGFVWLTLTNGDFRAETVPADAFESVLARIAPSETLVSEAFRNQLKTTHPNLVATSMHDWHFDAERGAKTLCELFGLDNLDAWEVSDAPEILAAANALLDYTKETQVDAMPFIQPLKRMRESEFVVIDPASRRGLEISTTVRGDKDGLTLFSVLDHCRSAMGSRELNRWLNQPLRDRDEAQSRHEAVEAFATDQTLFDDVAGALDAMPDIERITSRIALGSVRPRELAALRDALPAAEKLAQTLERRDEPLLHRIARTLRIDPAVGDKLSSALLDEPAVLLRDGDVIRPEYNEALKQLKQLRDDTGNFLVDLELREREATGIPSLRVHYNKVHGFYIEISKAAAKDLPLRYQRRQTLKNVERFITPELKTFEDQALSAKERVSALEKELYDELVEFLKPGVERLMACAHALAALDVLVALAEHAVERRWVRPTLSERAGITFKAGRHPVVETAIEVYVPNDCRLENGRRLLVITGPNMGGKSTYMRSVALIALLAWAGSFVPAESAVIGPIDRIHTRIGASDDLAHGRSTFMVEMTEAAMILNQATDMSLVLMDEIGRGTSTYDGLSLAAAIAESLVADTRAFTLFATHYFELTALAATVREVANIHVSATNTRRGVVFAHEISEGPASRSYGIDVAKLAGIPAPVIRRAKAFMTSLEKRDEARSAIEPDLFEEGSFLTSAAAERAHSENPQQEEDPASAEQLERMKALESFASEVAALDPESLSARDALNLVYALQEKAKDAMGS